MRQFPLFACEGRMLAATLDNGPATIGILLVSGGNEIRAGAHAGQAKLAMWLRSQGYPVFRYDRRGVGESEGENGGFMESGPDIAAAARAFRSAAPQIKRLIALGNCDAASALLLLGEAAQIDGYILTNPWTIDDAMSGQNASNDPTHTPSPAAIRARYINRLKDPTRLLRDVLGGRVNFGKLWIGVKKASHRPIESGLASAIGQALNTCTVPCRILVAQGDMTGQSFLGHWRGKSYAAARANKNISLNICDSNSHSFADAASTQWLREEILNALQAQSSTDSSAIP